MTTTEPKLWTGAVQNMATWLGQFCETNYTHLPQHAFWEIEAYLRKQAGFPESQNTPTNIKLARK